MLCIDHACAGCRFTCDWDPPAGHDWAGYPIRADAGMQGFVDKTLDPKKQYRCQSVSGHAFPTENDLHIVTSFLSLNEMICISGSHVAAL